MVKRIAKTCVSSVLVLTMLMNITFPTVQAAGFSVKSNTAITTEDSRSWNIAETLEHINTLNSIDNASEKAKVIPRKPDIGTIEETEEGLLEWLKGLFSGNTEVKSAGERTSAYISKDIVNKGISLVNGNNYIRLTPDKGNFDVYSVSNCAVRYTDVFDNIDYQFSSSAGNAQVKIICEGELIRDSFHFNLEVAKNLKIEKNNDEYIIYCGKEPLFIVSEPIVKDISGGVGTAQLSISDQGELVVKTELEWAQSLNRAYPLSVEFGMSAYEQPVPTVIQSKLAYAKSTEIGEATYTIETEPVFDYVHGIKTIKQIIISIEGNSGSDVKLMFRPEKGDEIEKEITGDKVNIQISEFESNQIYTVYVVDSDGEHPLEDTFLIYEIDEKNQLKKGSVYYLFYVYSQGASFSSEEFEDFKTDNDFSEQNCLFNGPSVLFFRNAKKSEHVNSGGYEGDEMPQFVSWLLGNGITDLNELGLEPINFNTGNFVYNAEDITLPDYNTDFVIERTYNALASGVDGVLGYGWTFNYEISLRRITGGTFVLSLGDGRTVWFQYNGSDFVASSGKNYSFSRVSDGYTVIDNQTKSVYKFDYYGYLISITDISGNTITFAYDSDNNLKSITNVAGILLEYNATLKDVLQS